MPFILIYLHELYGTHARVKHYKVSNVLYDCKLTKGSQVGLHIVKMISYIERLTSLGFIMDNELAIILNKVSFLVLGKFHNEL